MSDEILNTVIIGSGPAGLTAGIYAARAEIKPVIIAGLNPGGQLTQTTEVENFPGFPEGIMGPELMERMIKQAERFGTKVIYENVESVDFSSQPLKVKTDKNEYLTKTVILAMGAEANWLNLPNEQRLRGKGVSACATCDGFFFKGKEVVVSGGGDAAMEEAIFLTKYATKVTVLNRSAEFKASKIMLNRAQANPKIEFITNVQVIDVLGADKIEGVRLKDSVTGEERDFACQGMFVAIGHSPSTKFLNGQIEVDQKGYAIIKNNTESNVPGVFIAGDVADYRYRQAVTAAGAGTMAALDVEKYLAHH
jgi:thioredoxin reductase (NADPH)